MSKIRNAMLATAALAGSIKVKRKAKSAMEQRITEAQAKLVKNAPAPVVSEPDAEEATETGEAKGES